MINPLYFIRPTLRPALAVGGLIVAIAATNAFVLWRMHERTIKDAQTTLLLHSLTLSEVIDQTLRATDLMLGNVAEKVRLAAATDEAGYFGRLANQETFAMLREKVTELPQLAALAIAGPDGSIINTTRGWPVPSPHNVTDRQDFQHARANPTGTSFVEAPVRSASSGNWILILTRPVTSTKEQFLGVVHAAIDVRFFDAMFRATSYGERYAVSLMRPDGTLITRFPGAGVIGRAVAVPVLQTMGNSRSNVSRAISPIDGESRIAAAYASISYPLIVIATEPVEDVLAPWRNTAVMATAASGIAIIAIIVAAFAVAARNREQERLRLTEARRRFAIEAAELGTWDLNVLTGEATWSDRLRAIIGVPASTPATTRGFMNQVYPPDRPIIEQNVQTRASGPHNFGIEYRVVVDGGKLRWVSSVGRREFDESGRLVRIRGVIKDVTVRKEAENERDELRRHLFQAQEKERLRLAQELHDEAGQSVAAIKIHLERLGTFVGEAGRNQIALLKDQLQRMGKALHHVAWELRPPTIDELGLKEALSNYVADWSERTGIAADFFCDSALDALTDEVGTTCYRIVQEALTNVGRHAHGANTVSVIIEQVKDQLRLTVEDNGSNADVATEKNAGSVRHNGLGLTGMRERLLVLGGELIVEKPDSGGTTLFVRIPLRAAA